MLNSKTPARIGGVSGEAEAVANRLTNSRDEIILVCEMLNSGERRFSFPNGRRGKVVGGRGKGVDFDLGESLDGEIGEELVLGWRISTCDMGTIDGHTIHRAASIPP